MMRFLPGVVFATAIVITTSPLTTVLAQKSKDATGGTKSSSPQAQFQTLTGNAFKASTDAKSADDFSKIIELCEQALALEVDDNSYAKSLVSWAYNQRGQAWVTPESDADSSVTKPTKTAQQQAVSDFDTAIQFDSENWRAFLNRGISHAQLGEEERAIHDLDRAITLRPESAKAKYNRAEMRYSRGEYQMAIVDYSRAIDLDPSDAQAYTGLGYTHYQKGDFDKALENYDIALRFVARDAQAFANRADAYQKVGRWEKAWSDYRAALELDQTNGTTYRDVAWLLATCPDPRHRNSDLAEQAAEKALEILGENNARAWDVLAAAKARVGNFDEATAAIENAIKRADEQETAAFTARKQLYRGQQPFTQGDTLQR